MTADLMAAIARETQPRLTPGALVAWRGPQHIGGPYRVLAATASRVTVERGRGRKRRLWQVSADAVVPIPARHGTGDAT